MSASPSDRRAIGLRALVFGATLAVVSAVTTAASPDRNLLLISLDTVRADALGCNGAATATPHLDRLAAEGANFTRARTPVPLTLPSHASIFTATYPPVHTVRDNGGYVLPETRTTLTERLATAGFSTAAFVGSFVLDRRFGLAQGFETYDDRVAADLEMLENVEAERQGEEVFERFRTWLTERSDPSPFFAWIHLYDPHAPYVPPEPFRSRYSDDLYAGEVAYTDQVVGHILGELEARSLLDRTVVAVVGDHGEGLGEHGETTHSLLIYNSTLHVPMLLRAPGLVPPKRSVEALVRTIDLAPTLLDLLGLEPALGDGHSLRPLLDGTATTLGAAAYSESLYPRLHLGWSELVGLEDDRHRIVVAPQPELFDLAADPGETENLYDTDREAFRRLYRQLGDLQAAFPEEEAPSGPDTEVASRLRSLGYAAGPSARTANPDADPKARLDAWNKLQLGMAWFAQGDFEQAAALFEDLAAAEPDVPLVYEYLGTSYMRLGRRQEALTAYERGLERGIESTRALIDLGLIYRERGETTRAEQLFAAAAARDARSAEARHHLGDQQRAGGRLEAARASYRQALDLNPAYVYSWTGLGIVLSTLGEMEPAVEAFRRAVEIAPDEPLGRFNLAVQLERTSRASAAQEEYRAFLELAGTRPDLEAHRQQASAALRRLASRQ